MQILSHSNICSKIGVSKLTYNHLGRQQFNAKIEKIAIDLKSSMIMMIHTWKVLHNLASKASLYLNKKNDQYNITQ